MGQEPVYFKEKYFYANSQIVSWVQKFMELFMLTLNHPDWFKEVIRDMHGNFDIAYWKYFFDEEIIGDDKERLEYCLKMIDLTILKMNSITKKHFFECIKDEIKGSWCDISNEFYNEEWLNDDENFKLLYIGSLRRLKELMLQDIDHL